MNTQITLLHTVTIVAMRCGAVVYTHAGVAKLADAQDLKERILPGKSLYSQGFPPFLHRFFPRFAQKIINLCYTLDRGVSHHYVYSVDGVSHQQHKPQT